MTVAKTFPTNKAYYVNVAQLQLLMDVLNGQVPVDVASFSDLHDHVDANEYSDFCADDGPTDFLIEHFGGRDSDGGMPDGFIKFMDEVQGAVDAWIKSGGLKDSVHAADQK